jgi:DNA polymerase III sliding clamp (beta) subunit (PCNA family)
LEIKAEKLQEVLNLTRPVVPKKPTLKCLACVLVGGGKAVGTDLETMIIVGVPQADESILLPFTPVSDMLKYIPGHEILKIEQKDGNVSFKWSSGSASYPTEDPADYPVLPEMDKVEEANVNGDALVPAMVTALHYAAVEENRPTLRGVTLVLGNPIEVAAGDGFRMSHQALGISFPLEQSIIVPFHSVAVLQHVYSKTPRIPPANAETLINVVTAKKVLHMTLLGKNKLKVDFGVYASVIVNLVEGNPPNFLQLIPKEEPVLQSQLFAPQFEAAVKRVRGVAKDGGGIVRLEFADGKLKISAKAENKEISAVVDTLLTHGEPGRTAVNEKYLLEYLSGKAGVITVTKHTDTGPLLFQYNHSPKVLIMPMQVKWEDEEPEPVAVGAPQSQAEADEPTETEEGSGSETGEEEGEVE